ncbi:hypothetical protein CSUI_001440, partial [Cystoisospora suis]
MENFNKGDRERARLASLRDRDPKEEEEKEEREKKCREVMIERKEEEEKGEEKEEEEMKWGSRALDDIFQLEYKTAWEAFKKKKKKRERKDSCHPQADNMASEDELEKDKIEDDSFFRYLLSFDFLQRLYPFPLPTFSSSSLYSSICCFSSEHRPPLPSLSSSLLSAGLSHISKTEEGVHLPCLSFFSFSSSSPLSCSSCFFLSSMLTASRDSDPLVSWLIPARNASDTIVQAIASAACQRHCPP